MCFFFRKEKWRKNTKLTCWFPSTNREHPHGVRIASHTHNAVTVNAVTILISHPRFGSESNGNWNSIVSKVMPLKIEINSNAILRATEQKRALSPLPLPLFINRTFDIGLELKFEFESNLIVGWRWPCSAWWMVCFRRNSTDTNYSLDIRVAAGDCFYLFSTWAPQHRNFLLLIFDKSFSKWFWLDSWQITTSGNENVFEATMCVCDLSRVRDGFRFQIFRFSIPEHSHPIATYGALQLSNVITYPA